MFNGQSLATWIQDNILILVLIGGVVVVATAAITKELRKAVISGVIVLFSLLLLGIVANWQAISGWLFGVVFGG